LAEHDESHEERYGEQRGYRPEHNLRVVVHQRLPFWQRIGRGVTVRWPMRHA
jgi:hypothetical protein